MLRPSRVRATSKREPGHQRERRRHDDDLNVGKPHGEIIALEQRVAAVNERRQRFDACALRDLHEILQHNRHADRGNERCQAGGISQRPVGDAFHGPAVERGQRHGDKKHEKQSERHKAYADGDQHEESDQRGKRTDHENIAVREVDHPDDAVDHRVTDGDQAVDRAERNAVDELLDEIFHASAPFNSR